MDHKDANQEPKIDYNGSLDIPTFGKGSLFHGVFRLV